MDLEMRLLNIHASKKSYINIIVLYDGGSPTCSMVRSQEVLIMSSLVQVKMGTW